MKYLLKYKLIIVWVGLFLFTACDDEETADPVDPTTKPVVSIERVDNLGNNFSVIEGEGDVIEYNITSSHPMLNGITFTIKDAEGNEVDGDDYVVTGNTLPAYTTSTTMRVTFVNELEETVVPSEATENIVWSEVSATNVAQTWQVSPNSQLAFDQPLNAKVENVNLEDRFIIAFSWPNHDNDLDFYIISENDGNWAGNTAATGSNPEITTALWPSDPNGIYHVVMDPFVLEGNTTEYTINVGFEDGSRQLFTGVFDVEDDSYEMIDGLPRLLKIELTDDGYIITQE